MRSLLIIVLIAATFFAGRYVGRNSVQSANDLLSVGFVITDPEGFEIERFDS